MAPMTQAPADPSLGDGAGRVPSSESALSAPAANASLLTPLVAEHLALATPALPAASAEEAEKAPEADSRSSQAAKENAQEETEERVSRQVVPKRSPRVLFGSFDEEEAAEQATLGGGESREPHKEGERKRALPSGDLDGRAVARESVQLTPCEGDREDRKKWKRSLPPPAQRRGIFSPPEPQPSRPSFVRSMSSQSIFIDKAAGDCASSSSATPLVHRLALPTTHSKSHPDLNVIAPETVSRLLRGDFADRLASFALVDCRFSYEFQGGSLRTAQSLSNPARVEEQFLWSPPADCKRTALIFFCEFSANRAPKMLRHVRNLDRWVHAEQYPELFYPELYLIDGGYKKCFETAKEICEPPSYTPMNHSAFVPSCKREFGLWRKHWKAHKTNACAAKLQQHHSHNLQQQRNPLLRSSPGDGDTVGDDDSAFADPPPPAPPVPMRSLSEMLQ